MTFTSEFLVGIALAVPLAIFANLLTPSVQSLLDRRSKKAALSRGRRDKVDLERIEVYSQKPEIFFTLLIEAGLKATLYSAVTGILAAIVYALGQLSPFLAVENYRESRHIWNELVIFIFPSLSVVLGSIIGTIGSLLVIGIIRPVLQDAVRFRNYDQYKDGVRNHKNA